MKKIYLFLVCVNLLSISLFAQNNSAAIDDFLAKNVADFGGRAFLMIYKDGKVVYANGDNEMNMRQKMLNKVMARRQKMPSNTNDYTAETRLPIASCSKWLSAALVMTFVDEGKLKLTDTVGKFLPVLSKSGKGNITISQCLAHLTAIKSPPLKEDLADMRTFNNMDDAIANIATMPMEGKPGKVFRYSNVGLQIAGAVIEKIASKAFETLFQERIAQPLEMKNTSFGTKLAFPAGGASSTTTDYIHFLTMVLNKGKYNNKQILTPKSISLMQVNQIVDGVTVAYAPAEAGDLGYGFGEWVPKTATLNAPSAYVTSPGLFGSFPIVHNDKQYVAFLMTYNLKSSGRKEKYQELISLMNKSF